MNKSLLFYSTTIFVCLFIQCIVFASNPGSPDGSSLGLGTFSNSVRVTKIQSDGKILVGGDFTFYKTLPTNGLIRLNVDGIIDNTFDIGSGPNGSVKSIIFQLDGKILVGGNFTTFNGVSKNYLVRLNSDGSIDNTFDIGAGANNNIRSIILQPNGKIVVGGDFTTFNNNPQNRLVRLNTNGSVDNAFNIGSGANNYINTTVLQSDGKILVGGFFDIFNGISESRLVRLNSDGSIDNTFDTGTGATYEVNSIAIQPDEKVIVGGYFTYFNEVAKQCLVRLNADGSIDNTFDIGLGANLGSIYSIIILPNHKIIIAGQFTAFNNVSINRLARLNIDGSVDNTFNIGSGVNVGGTVFNMEVLGNGKILVGGWFTSFNDNFSNHLVRINADGSFDNTFQNNPWGANESVYQIAVQADNKIIVGGDFSIFNGIEKKYLVRLNSDGSIDNTFNIGIGPNNVIRSVTIQADGKILVGGSFTAFNGVSQNRLIRLNVDGTIDNAFNVGLAANNAVYAISIQQDHKIVVGGDFTTFQGISQSGLIRLYPDGSIDNSFTIGTGVGTSIAAPSLIKTIVFQQDGKMLIGGNFDIFNGSSSKRFILRLNVDGSVDNTFNIGTGANGGISSILLQSDGKIVLAGVLNEFNGTQANYLFRLNSDGSVDNTFNIGSGSNAFAGTSTMALLSDGKILVGGWFTSFNGAPTSHLVCLNADGSVDNSFEVGSGASACVFYLTLQSDGKILLGGAFLSYNGFPTNHIVRLEGEVTVITGLKNTIYNNTVVSVYPNPTIGMLTIEVTEYKSNSEIQIISIEGVIQKTVPLNNSLKQEVNLGDIRPGMYLYVILQDGKHADAGKLVIK